MTYLTGWLAGVRGLEPVAVEVLSLKKPLLESSWLLFHRLSWISYVFWRCHEISWIGWLVGWLVGSLVGSLVRWVWCFFLTFVRIFKVSLVSDIFQCLPMDHSRVLPTTMFSITPHRQSTPPRRMLGRLGFFRIEQLKIENSVNIRNRKNEMNEN